MHPNLAAVFLAEFFVTSGKANAWYLQAWPTIRMYEHMRHAEDVQKLRLDPTRLLPFHANAPEAWHDTKAIVHPNNQSSADQIRTLTRHCLPHSTHLWPRPVFM
jgi:hypothetical protein